MLKACHIVYQTKNPHAWEIVKKLAPYSALEQAVLGKLGNWFNDQAYLRIHRNNLIYDVGQVRVNMTTVQGHNLGARIPTLPDNDEFWFE